MLDRSGAAEKRRHSGSPINAEPFSREEEIDDEAISKLSLEPQIYLPTILKEIPQWGTYCSFECNGASTYFDTFVRGKISNSASFSPLSRGRD